MHTSLYDPRFEHDACGVGFLARLSGRPDHEMVRLGLTALGRLEHRGAVAADGRSADGAGILTQIPRRFFARELERLGRPLPGDAPLGVGMVFSPFGDERTRASLDAALRGQGLRVLAWREVPMDPGELGDAAYGELPRIRQVMVAPGDAPESDFERRLYLARKTFERDGAPGYVCSLSSRTLVYKALCLPHHLASFYADLRDPLYESALVVYHQRYSTNTLPSWEMVQPFRLLAHNGEINTLWGNRAWMRVREAELPLELHPLLPSGGSDSAALDGALELLARNGRHIADALGTLVPPAWEETGDAIPEGVREFYRAHAPMMEPWDGPAALAFTDGRWVGAALDRNGLRPCRYEITRDGLVVAGSEVGLVTLDEAAVIEKGRLGPGEMLLVDLAEGRVLHDAEIKGWMADTLPRPRWSPLPLHPEADAPLPGAEELPRLHRLFGLDREEQKYVLPPMVEEGAHAVWSMGDDTPVAPLARAPRPLYAFFRQRFAQVTNPPIDPLRERRVMSLRTWLGPRTPLLGNDPGNARFYELVSPVLSAGQVEAIRRGEEIPMHTVACGLDPERPDLPSALQEICELSEAAVRSGAQLLLLSDRAVSPGRAPLPMALVVGAVHHRLIETGLRTGVGILVEVGDCWEPHHAAVLIGYGAGAVFPWLASATARALDPERGEERLRAALEDGLLKILSKMGISTVGSYRGGQLFEILGLGDEVVEMCFTGTPSRIGGLGFADLLHGVLERHRGARGAGEDLPDYGRIRFRRGEDSEAHAWQPPVVRALQRSAGSARGKGEGADPQAWDELRRLSREGEPTQLRDLLEMVPAGPELPLERVEPAEEIARRFIVSAMSLGALSPEAHRTLTLAANRLGARSNSGEGGEDPELYTPELGSGRLDNRIKQVASGRFGVTAEYLARAEELEIKIAQGAKPGEGGQLPGHKVTELIARLRHSRPGVSLISPPPHHDIYSIEDLAQLVYDLKMVNPRARVGVKLVAEAGVGTVAAGMAKAFADYVVIAGHSGGTGASPLSSIKHAGVPWELGLAETQQVLMRNGLRSRVRVRTDGGLTTGRDVVIAALLGADEFGFGTAPLVALGCDMARQCHLNSCPTGIATQRPELRAKFRGTPEQVIRFFLHVAEEVRATLAGLGLASLEEATGRADLLRQERSVGGVKLDRMLARVTGDLPRCTVPAGTRQEPIERGEPLEHRVARDAAPFVEHGAYFSGEYPIQNRDRSVGARLSGEIATRWGGAGLPPGTVEARFTGSAGQSFGAFAARGVRLTVVGEANDYVGKGLSGGELVLRPRPEGRESAHRNVILGNVALYGATSGSLLAAGRAGERFAVRNSGASAVVEGVGDHGCEYMTGGVVVVLGETGWNFGAGMTGGTAFVLDPAGSFPARVNRGTVECARPDAAELESLRPLLEAHRSLTGSLLAERLLAGWSTARPHFWRVAPKPAPQPTPLPHPPETLVATLP